MEEFQKQKRGKNSLPPKLRSERRYKLASSEWEVKVIQGEKQEKESIRWSGGGKCSGSAVIERIGSVESQVRR